MIPRPTLKVRKELKEDFAATILSVIKTTGALYARDNINWGAYSTMRTWPGSCGNKEWTGISDDELSHVKTPLALMYWMLLVRKTFKKYKLGNVFYSYPTTKNRTSFYNFTKIHKATELLKNPLVARSWNPNYHDPNPHYQNVYLLCQDKE